MKQNTITLLDGRTLGYALYGPPDGKAVLYFHGTPSSRLEPLLLKEYGIDAEALLQQNNLQLIVPDRPGMGLSDFNASGNFLSFADDARQLLHQLQIKNCSLLCWSGGGPFCLAMANLFPKLVKNVFMLCAFTRRFDAAVLKEMSLNKWYFRTARHLPWLLKTIMNWLQKKQVRQPVAQWLTGLPDVDYKLLNDAHHFKTVPELTLKEACRNGAHGAVYEAALYYQPFGFELSNILQSVYYWWGTEDNSVIKLHATTAEQQLPDCRINYVPHEGHLSLYIKYFATVLKTISLSEK